MMNYKAFNMWEHKKLNSIFELNGGTTPSTSKREYWNGDILWATPTDIKKLINSSILYNTEKKITHKAVNDNSLRLFKSGTLFLTSRASIGWTILTGREITINQGITALLPKNENEVYPLFYYYYFRFIRNLLNSLASGSTFKEISKSTLRNLHIPLPPLSTQKKIAEILSTADAAIQKVDEAIEKTQRLKKGVMLRLLTKGIGHTEFKDTEIGRIPGEWEVRSLSKVFKLNSGKSRPKLMSSVREDINTYPIYGGNGILGYTNDYLIDKDTIVIGRVGYYCGSVFKAPKYSWISDNALYVTEFKTNDVIIDYLNIYLSFLNLNKFKKQSGQPLITQSIVNGISIPVPQKSEQRIIVDIESNIDKYLELLKTKKQKLQRIKQGLMNELLTGKVEL